ncbi:type I-U CRISPR-associated RAMP protein Csb1/Cas7u [Asticcacaulis sp.]|uniref:type I-G CRISPR-associated RAMP protein Csb1/Cas7g n=1 Tax=Asticcacaulis sp. TaxID=1872648 RepID=UPI00262911C2|nr:type I-U CRISPR-associated RAMP protein Csb1/Cas7u [Asticcacaulis sp.]
MDFPSLSQMVAGDAALRRRQVLQPVGGRGDKIFPPTYPGEGRNAPPRHVHEVRRIDGKDVDCVLVDSVQSQANRLEEALLEAVRDGVRIPHLLVDFSGEGLAGLTQITSLDAPHRVYDAILRDSLLEGQPFMKSPLGEALAKAKIGDATAVLEASPTALLFGAWHSTGDGGGIGAKFARCVVSEISAIGVSVEEFVADKRTGELEVRTTGRRTGSRIDPLGVLRKVEVFKGGAGWDTDKARAGKGAKQVRPSEINHGNIAPSVMPLGITCDYAEHMMVLSFAALRRLRFGSPARDAAGRGLLAALGLLAVAEQDAQGYALRSRCDLVCDGRASLQLVKPDGAVADVALDRVGARALFTQALDAATQAGFTFPAGPIRLTPQPKLVEIVRRSQELALAGEGGEEGDENGDA